MRLEVARHCEMYHCGLLGSLSLLNPAGAPPPSPESGSGTSSDFLRTCSQVIVKSVTNVQNLLSSNSDTPAPTNMSPAEDKDDKHTLPVANTETVPELPYSLRDRRPSSVARDKERQDSRTRSFTSGRERPAFQLSHHDEDAIEEDDERDHVR
jgi:hypothetical protein